MLSEGQSHGCKGATDVPIGRVCRVPETRLWNLSAMSYGCAGAAAACEAASSQWGDAGATTAGYGEKFVPTAEETGEGPRTAEGAAKLGGETGGDSANSVPANFADGG
jgi:hypothetical protein